MILIWQRWGILAILFVPLGLGIGFLLKTILGVESDSKGPDGMFIGIGLILSAVVMWFVVRATVGKVIDKPRPAVVWQQLAEPIVGENGAKQTHRAVPVTDPDTGTQLWTQPRSTLFFVPLKFWPFVLAVIGAVVFVINLVTLSTQN